MGRCGCLGTRRTAWGGFADTHNRLSSRCQSVVWFLTLRPGGVPSPFAGYLPEAFPNCRTRGSNSRVLQLDHLMSSHNSQSSGRWFELSGAHDRAQDVFPQPPKTAFRLNPLICNGLTRLDEVWTKSRRNGECGPNREFEAAQQDEFGRRETERE